MDKIWQDAISALKGILQNNQVIAVGGFGLCGIPEMLIDAVSVLEIKNLTVVSNNAGTENIGLGVLLKKKQIKKMISSYVGENKEFERQYLNGELEVEFTPQGTLAEKLKAAGSGIPAFFTRTGVGTLVSEGKELRLFQGKEYIMEHSIFPDVALIKVDRSDIYGNCVFRLSARNFNPIAAMAAKICIAEVDTLVSPGEISPDEIHLPGIYVNRIVVNKFPRKHIENVVTKQR